MSRHNNDVSFYADYLFLNFIAYIINWLINDDDGSREFPNRVDDTVSNIFVYFLESKKINLKKLIWEWRFSLI